MLQSVPEVRGAKGVAMSQQLTRGDVLNRLRRVRIKGQGCRSFTAECPSRDHNNQPGRLTITATDTGRVLLLCRAGCSEASIHFALGLEKREGGRIYERQS